MAEPLERKFSSVFEMDSTVVDCSLEGFVTANSGLVLLEGHKIILRRDYRQLDQVRVMSGGGSGLEPMYTGFVGPGILTAAVIGEKYCAPPFTTVLTAIRELAVNNPYGVLIILMNDPVSRMNFMLAVECAMRENIRVRMIFVGDDSSGAVCQHGRKGLAGIALVFKVAGAMADQKRSLEEICDSCAELSSVDIATVTLNVLKLDNKGFCRSEENVCSLTGSLAGSFSHKQSYSESKSIFSSSEDLVTRAVQVQEDLVDNRPSETGYHLFSSLTDLAGTLLGYIVDGTKSPYSILKEANKPVVILVNNYGFMLILELNALVRELIVELKKRKICVRRVYVGTVIGSRSIGGFSVTAMKVNEDLIDCLDHPVTASGWPTTVLYQGDSAAPLSRHVKAQSYYEEQEPKELGPLLDVNTSKMIYRALDFVCMALVSCEAQMNKVGSMCNDSLYGSHLKMTVNAISEALYSNKLKVHCPYALFYQLSMICGDTLHNAGGCLYAIFFDGVSQSFLGYLNETAIQPHMWTYALESGITAIEHYSGIKKGQRTMLDALYPMLEAMKKSVKNYASIAEAAELGSINTVDPDVQNHSMPDPSTHTVALWARAAVEGLISFKPTKEINLEEGIKDWYSIDEDGP